MTDSDLEAYTTGGHITVRRDLHGCNTNLVEVWELEYLAWVDGENEYDIVKCHVADLNQIPNNGVPYSDKCVTASCSFEELPEEVQEQFVIQAENLKNAVDNLAEDE